MDQISLNEQLFISRFNIFNVLILLILDFNKMRGCNENIRGCTGLQ